jgi:hypothetical protein
VFQTLSSLLQSLFVRLPNPMRSAIAMDIEKTKHDTDHVAEAASTSIPLGRTITTTTEVVEDSLAVSDASADRETERKLIRKLDFQLLPMVYLLCLVNILVKTNIGNARIQGLEKDLGMDTKSNQFNFVLSIFWVPYILSEVP